MINTKYAVYNAETGENVFFETKEEAIQGFWSNVIKIAKTHFHDTAYMVIETNEDGSETWYNDENKEIEKPKTIEEIIEIQEAAKAAMEFKAKVEILP